MARVSGKGMAGILSQALRGKGREQLDAWRGWTREVGGEAEREGETPNKTSTCQRGGREAEVLRPIVNIWYGLPSWKHTLTLLQPAPIRCFKIKI